MRNKVFHSLSLCVTAFVAAFMLSAFPCHAEYAMAEAYVPVSFSGEAESVGKFTAQLVPVTDNAPMPENSVVEAGPGEDTRIGPIRIGIAGDWKYELKQASVSDGWDKDPSVYTVEIMTTYNENENAVEAAVCTWKGSGTKTASPVFNNTNRTRNAAAQSSPSGTVKPKTGDDFNLASMLALLAAEVFLLMAGGFLARNNKSRSGEGQK